MAAEKTESFRPDKRRISILVSILISYSIVALAAGGIGWLSFHRQAETIGIVTSLYNRAFEGANNAHWAYNKFQHAQLLWREGGEKAREEANLWTASIKEHLALANDFIFTHQELALIAGLRERFDALDMENAQDVDTLDRDMRKLVQSFIADRLDSRDFSIAAIDRSRQVVTGFLGLSVIFVMLMAAAMIMALLPQLRHAVSIAQSIAGGKLDNKIVVKGIRETAVLLRSLGAMQNALSQNIANLEAARERAIKSENVKSEFLANMSHELRTPLNNIIGSIQLLQDGAVREKDKELFGLVERSSISLLGIVNDILDLSKIEAGEVHLESIPFDVSQKVRDVTKMFAAQSMKKGITLYCEALDPLYVLGDPHRFDRVLTNLVGNALRYTEKGSIRIIMSRLDDVRENRARLRIAVADTGIGIPKDRQEKIFDRFTQSDNSTSRKYGGTGLGLTITRELVNLMAGKIGVESEVGKGSTFWFEVPFELTEKPKDEEREAAALVKHAGSVPVDKARILVAEDHELNRAFMRRLFEHLGISSYVFAETGVEAVEEIKTRAFDVVLMDCHMPEMDGYTATGVIRGLDDQAKSGVPIVAMTANAMESDRERCLKAGMNAYIGKPFEFDEFKRTLAPWVDFTAGRPEQAPLRQDESGTLDPAALAALAKGGDDYLNEMLDIFVETAAGHVARLTELAGGADRQSWIDEAHALKGAAAIIGAGRMRQLAAQAQNMEDITKAGAEIADALHAEFQKLKIFISNLKQEKALSPKETLT